MNNAIVVRGTQEQVNEVLAAIKVITGGTGTSGVGQAEGNTRIITIDKGNAATLAEALKRLMSQMRDNPVKIVTPDAGKPDAPPMEKPKDDEHQRESGAQGDGADSFQLAALHHYMNLTVIDLSRFGSSRICFFSYMSCA